MLIRSGVVQQQHFIWILCTVDLCIPEPESVFAIHVMNIKKHGRDVNCWNLTCAFLKVLYSYSLKARWTKLQMLQASFFRMLHANLIKIG